MIVIKLMTQTITKVFLKYMQIVKCFGNKYENSPVFT